MNQIKITNGNVYDPLERRFEKRTIAVNGSVIAENPDIGADFEVDVEGCIVAPGLIDYHIHAFSGSQTGSVNVDLACLPNGVTTAVDAGTSGAPTFPVFYEHDIMRSVVRLKSYLNIASTGIITFVHNEHVDPSCIESDLIKEMFRRYPRELVSLKIRYSNGIVRQGDEAPLKAMLELAEEIGCNIVVHTTNPAIPCERIAELLRPGDVFCHMYQGIGDTILGQDGKVKPQIWQAQRRGVVFDACNGNSNFSFRVASPAIEQGFLPDIISSDLTPMSLYREFVYSLPKLLSKYLAYGMSLEQVFDCAILHPAKLLGMEKELATLAPATTADIAVFKLVEQGVVFRDKDGTSMTGEMLLVPQMTIKDGVIRYSQVTTTQV